jgi:hypothetical protein
MSDSSDTMISRFPLTVLVVMAAATWALILIGNGWVLRPSFFLPLSIVIGVLSLALLIFDWWAWAWFGFRLFSKRPDLRGTWKGTIRSNWKSADGLDRGAIEAYISIYQTYTGFHFRLFTQESQSVTIIASLACEPDDHYVVSGVYRNEPNQLIRSRSPIHHGGLILNVSNPSQNQMSGTYWTDRQTHGEMEFHRVSRHRFAGFKAAEEGLPKQ